MYHYTAALDDAFAVGLHAETSVTPELYISALHAGRSLGIPTPTRVIPIIDRGQFRPNRLGTVLSTDRNYGGGLDFKNPEHLAPEFIIPGRVIRN